MKKLLLIIALLISTNSNAQFLKEVYNDFLKYGTFYAAGNIGNAKSEVPQYFIRTNPEDLYAIPDVIDETVYHDFDYRYGIGVRKLARFDYEVKPGNFWTGNSDIEKQVALSAPTSAVKGLEYLLHWEKERKNGDEFTNKRLFVRHTGKYHIAKFESREQGNVGFEYLSGEIRARLPIGKKFSVSAGAIYRTHQKAYGYNPIEIWLNETIQYDWNPGVDYPANPWYSLGYEYGYSDHFTTYTDDNTGQQTQDWIWKNEEGVIVAYSDIQFRDEVFGGLMNRYNNEIFETLDPYAEVAPIIGMDFYHYKNNFWLHAYGNWIMPYHKYLKGDGDFTYLNRNNWGKGGLKTDSTPEQWSDYQAGLMFGWKVSKSLGVFVEGEYTKFWNQEIYSSNFGINITLR
jgi:hypothetical protein